jgi:hypothetical protein
LRGDLSLLLSVFVLFLLVDDLRGGHEVALGLRLHVLVCGGEGEGWSLGDGVVGDLLFLSFLWEWLEVMAGEGLRIEGSFPAYF